MTQIRKLFVFIVCLVSTLTLSAQTNLPVRLAVVPETPDAGMAADLLTTELSNNQKVQLLEREQIDKVYHEQGLSAVNRDYLKLGQILGADGLLIVELVQATNQFSNNPFQTEQPRVFNVRLIAVKPGVVLTAERFSLLTKDLPDWVSSFSKHLELFLPKLGVLAKDAVPISVVNLRSAVASTDAAETERELKTLTIQRLSQEPQLFVLERQRMQSLSEEKELKSDESAFWNGSYLLEGVVDQNGYSKDTVTINARLTPPKGGQPLLFDMSGSRTNLPEVVNSLVVKVAELLKVNSATKEWNAADEATQYFNEAQWALRWGMLSEAQMAAETSWSLGRRDLQCAQLRVTAYMDGLPEVLPPNMNKYKHTPGYHFVHINEPPDAADCDMAARALECYYEFSRISPDGGPRIFSNDGNGWRKTDWYQLGVDLLTASSDVLRHFYFFPEAQKPVAAKLTDLRSLARSVASLISKSPSIHDSYFAGDRMVSPEEFNPQPVTVWVNDGPTRIYREQTPNIFECAIQWGCFWQERPEDGVELYRELMNSPLFFRIHGGLWFRETDFPRLVGWNAEDEKRVPAVWSSFMRELEASTNYFYRFEGKAFACADARTSAWEGKDPSVVGNAELVDADPRWKTSRAALLEFISANYESIVWNNGNLPRNDWGVKSLFGQKSEYASQFDTIQQAYISRAGEHLKEVENRETFDKQKRYLASLTPYDMAGFNAVFQWQDYTKEQAAELKPLIAPYKSNLLASAVTVSPLEKLKAKSAVRWVEFYLEQHVNAALNPPAPAPLAIPTQQPQASPAVIPSAAVARKPEPPPAASQTPELITNVLSVTKFLPIPLDGLPGDIKSAVTITSHHWLEGKLVMDFQYSTAIYSFDAQTNWTSTRLATLPAIAILGPRSEQWQVIACPEMDITAKNPFYHHTTLCRGELFTSDGGQVRKFDAAKNAWQVLDIPDVGNCELFTVNGHLYAATRNLIVEILDGGNRTRILASNRRQPPVSSLDTEDLGTPALFAGPGQSLRVATANQISSWDGQDWHLVCPAPRAPSPPVISDDAVLFFADGWNTPAGIWRLATETNQFEFCLGEEARHGISMMTTVPNSSPKPAWKLPHEISLPRLPAASRGRDLYLMTDHAKSEKILDEQQHVITGYKVLPQDGYHAALLCFAGDDPSPLKIYLKFDGENANPPVTGDNRGGGFMIPNVPSPWLLFSSNYFFCGRETPDALPIASGASATNGPRTGVWMVPLDQIDHELALQKVAHQEQQTQAAALTGLAMQKLLEKYDRNHNGVIDPDEREEALDDPAFIKSELNSIDTNHNGWLDAPELVWFDANQNKVLDPKEQAGIDIARHLLAEKLLNQFDRAGNGWLDRMEYDEMVQSSLQVNPNNDFNLQFPRADVNHDNHVDLEELENLMQRQLERQLFIRGRPGFYPTGMNPRPLADSQEQFKSDVESYWRSPGSRPNRPPMSAPMSPGAESP